MIYGPQFAALSLVELARHRWEARTGTSAGGIVGGTADACGLRRPQIGTERLSPARALRGRLQSLRGLLRLKSFDTSTEEGRSRERYRRAALTTASSVMARAVTVGTSLITVRLTIHYLGVERYGLWMTITSVVSLLWFADLGMGNGLLNAIADAHGRDDRESVRRYVSSAFFVLLAVAAVLLVAFALVYPFVPWPRLFNVSTAQAGREAGPALFIFLAYFLCNMPLDVVQRVQTGHQEGFATNLWTAVGSVLGLGGLCLALHLGGGLAWLILGLLGGQLLGVAANWAREFGFARPELLPAWSFVNRAAAHRILSTGVMFFVLSVCNALNVPLDNIVITQVLGPAAVTQYSVPMRFFQLVASLAAMFVVPLWPAYGEALARQDLAWVKSTVYRSLGYSALILTPVALALAAAGKFIVRVWVGTQVQPTYVLLFGMALWAVFLTLNLAISMFLSGVGELKFQVAVALSASLTSLLLRIVMARMLGTSGVIWASCLVLAIADAVLILYVPRLLDRIAKVPLALGKAVGEPRVPAALAAE